MYIYSPSPHQHFYQKFIEGFTNYIPINKIQNTQIKKDLHLIIEEIVNDKYFEKPERDMETYESIKDLKYP